MSSNLSRQMFSSWMSDENDEHLSSWNAFAQATATTTKNYDFKLKIRHVSMVSAFHTGTHICMCWMCVAEERADKCHFKLMPALWLIASTCLHSLQMPIEKVKVHSQTDANPHTQMHTPTQMQAAHDRRIPATTVGCLIFALIYRVHTSDPHHILAVCAYLLKYIGFSAHSSFHHRRQLS